LEDVLLRLEYAKQLHGRNRSDRRTILAAAAGLKSRAGRAISLAQRSVSDANERLREAIRRYEEVASAVRGLNTLPAAGDPLVRRSTNDLR